jgi:hypothetical protein
MDEANEQRLRDRAITLALDAFADTDQYVEGDYTEENCRRALFTLAEAILNFLKGNQHE